MDATRAASQSRFTALAVQTADRVETAAEHAPDGRHRDRGRDGEREEERRDKGHPTHRHRAGESVLQRQTRDERAESTDGDRRAEHRRADGEDEGLGEDLARDPTVAGA